MESATPAASNFGSFAGTITKILRFRRNIRTCSNKDDETYKPKPSKTVEEHPSVPSGPLEYSNDKAEDKKQRQPEAASINMEASINREATESLLANLFASVSAVKAAYVQLQLAQSPYDPEIIQSSDQAIVSELKHLSELKQSFYKQSFYKKQLLPQPTPAISCQIQEHQNLIKTYQITTKKLEIDIQAKDSEICTLQSKLIESDRQNRSLESQLHPGRSLSCLDDLHLSGLDPTHFLSVVRYTVKSVKYFTKLMMCEMESAEWDLDAAAVSIQPDVHRRPNHLIFAFESFVSEKMFSGFQDRDFGLPSLRDLSSRERCQFFAQFAETKSVKLKQYLWSPKGVLSALGKFCRLKYLSLVHPKMELSFFGNLNQRELISQGHGFPRTDFFMGFAGMARRVWLMHCLFFSFVREMEPSVFQVSRGCRFSDVYMESVVESEPCLNGASLTVGFTVVPGFRVGKTVMQCKVYASGRMVSGWL